MVSCGEHDTTVDVEEPQAPKFPDGTYCANVDYYNPSTGTKRTYTLNVEVESNEVTTILFGNGGYLDNSHISPETLSNGGYCSITDDKNRTFDISINGSACSSIDNIDDGESGSEEKKITLLQCASIINMTEQEMLEYEKEFNESRNDLITDDWCKKFMEFIEQSREHKRKKEEMERQMNEGYIQTLKSLGDDDNISCQSMIVKRYGQYYLLEVAGPRRAMMGLTSFTTGSSNWQNIYIKESFDKTMYMYQARVVDQASSMSALQNEMDNYCN